MVGKHFSEEEVKTAVWDCDGNKSPRPEGFTLEFYQQCWDTVKVDVGRFVLDFFHIGGRWSREFVECQNHS